MPVLKCTNGKYRIGQGACIYDTEEKATKVYQAILAGGGFVDADKVSIDFDDTLSTTRGQDLAKKLIAEGNNVYIVTRRQSSSSAEVYKVTDELGIARSKVHFTDGKMKWEEIKKLGIGTHYDNNQKEIDLINSNTQAKGIKFQFAEESYNDYPEEAVNNAKRALAYADENGWGSCGTPVGKARANQLANKEAISRDTIARMASFKRQQQNKDVPYGEGCGGLMWDAWGGDAGVEWAIRKLEQIDKVKLVAGLPHYTKDGKLWTGPTHKDASGKLMTGSVHTPESVYLYHYDELAEIGPKGGIKESDKAPKSDTPNKNPKGEGTSKGDASGKRGAEVTQAQEQTLKDKVKEFNDRESNIKNGKATLGALKAVFVRGLGAYNTSHSPLVKSPSQWAFARVNAFLYLLKNGRPENPKYDTDFDLLPEKHPKYSK